MRYTVRLKWNDGSRFWVTWDNGDITCDPPELQVLLESDLTFQMGRDWSLALTPTGPFFRGRELLVDPLGFVTFLQTEGRILDLVDGELPPFPKVEPDRIY